ncbi:MAG TPA: methylated-DNA--[protein]-cysteine S-methyltransferase [Candidatus Borkfalkia excrementigallinarum]|uniref:Methylated-DNA--protein-cysteine methyltransferase n=1 Tax=Candidatus Borkfalkia excrementigallinarum TaxID=2838506 RepID=A0A9D1ZUQ0_9FIRM|nr:methylated-DNA--[protein]-cysteine S-methyltransferase [Candidatus Borkfalkia excrementigallinarum]
MLYIGHCETPLGGVTLASDGEVLTGLWFDGQKYFGAGSYPDAAEKELPVFGRTREWLRIYFGGRNPDFTPPLSLIGSPFRRAVWEMLLRIPYGKTMTYGEIARLMGEESGHRVSARAVGGAVGHNPVSLIVPCHRVVGANGNLTGYAGGIERKRYLLALERAMRK